MNNTQTVTVVGAGLAGSEAAWQLAERGIHVRLYEMKPEKMTPAHHSPNFAELVCSNSLRSDELTNAVGLLKEELRELGSLVMRCADAHRVAAGGALAVDREGFSAAVTEAIRSHPNIEVIAEEVTDIPTGEVIVASGPLTSDVLAEKLAALSGEDSRVAFADNLRNGLEVFKVNEQRRANAAQLQQLNQKHNTMRDPTERRKLQAQMTELDKQQLVLRQQLRTLQQRAPQ